MKADNTDKIIRILGEIQHRLQELQALLQEQKKMEAEVPKSLGQPQTAQDRLIPVTKWNDYHNWPSVGGLRSLIFNAYRNGFNKVIRRCGRRVLVDEKAFFDWIREGAEEIKGR